MSEDRYFQINDDVGLDPEGNPQPLHEIGVAASIPTMRNGAVVDVAQRVTVKPIAGTRTFKTDDPIVAAAILDSGLVREIDPPTKTDLGKERKQTQDAREKSGTHTDAEEA